MNGTRDSLPAITIDYLSMTWWLMWLSRKLTCVIDARRTVGKSPSLTRYLPLQNPRSSQLTVICHSGGKGMATHSVLP